MPTAVSLTLENCFDKIEITNDCWYWKGANTNWGYGILRRQGKNYLAHRYIYERMIECIPKSMQLDHLCRNRICVNPFHMLIVTKKDNILRGSSISAIYAERKYCSKGHELTDDNICSWTKGRSCKKCYESKRHDYDVRKGLYCPSGHKKIEDNLILGKDGHRYCKICAVKNVQNVGGD